MSRTVLTHVDGWTPVIDFLIKEHGLITAVVFGRIWRYCQGERGVCSASLEKIGEEIGVDRRTVMRHVKKLCDAGYLEDTTPNVKHRPHIYRDTGKASMQQAIRFTKSSPSQTGVTESHTSQKGVTESHTRSDRESHRGVTESHLKIQVKRQEEETIKNMGAKAPAPENFPPEDFSDLVKNRSAFEALRKFEGRDSEIDLSDFPEDVREVIHEFHRLWKVPVPRKHLKKGGDFALWISDVRALLAIDGFRLAVLQRVYDDYRVQTDQNQGVPPFTVGRPGALTKTVRAKIGLLNQGGIEADDYEADLERRRAEAQAMFENAPSVMAVLQQQEVV